MGSINEMVNLHIVEKHSGLVKAVIDVYPVNILYGSPTAIQELLWSTFTTVAREAAEIAYAEIVHGGYLDDAEPVRVMFPRKITIYAECRRHVKLCRSIIFEVILHGSYLDKIEVDDKVSYTGNMPHITADIAKTIARGGSLKKLISVITSYRVQF